MIEQASEQLGRVVIDKVRSLLECEQIVKAKLDKVMIEVGVVQKQEIVSLTLSEDVSMTLMIFTRTYK